MSKKFILHYPKYQNIVEQYLNLDGILWNSNRNQYEVNGYDYRFLQLSWR